MPPSNGSIANLLVTRKSLDAPDDRTHWNVTRDVLSGSVSEADDGVGGTRTQIKSRRWKGAGFGRSQLPALERAPAWLEGFSSPRLAERESLDYFWMLAYAELTGFSASEATRV